MKQTLQVYSYLLCLWLLAASVQAQTDTRSRLELGRNKPAGRPLPAQKFLLAPKATFNSLDRSFSVRNSPAINAYYRSLLIAPTTSATKGAARPAAVVVETASSSLQSSEPRQFDERQNAEDRLYASDHLTVSNIYPNPASETAQVDYRMSPSVGEAKLTLLSVLGTPIPEYDQALDHNDNKLRIVTHNLATGIYFYQLSVDGQKVAIKKLSVIHQ